MKNTRSQKKPVSAEAIARMAERGKDVSRFFTNKGRMMGPIQRVNVDFTVAHAGRIGSTGGRAERQPSGCHQDHAPPGA